MVHNTQFYSAYVGGKEQYDFKPVFEPIKKHIESSDFAMANLETTLSGKDMKYSNYPRFNSPEQIADALKYTGFDMVTTANNHAMDRGNYGVIKTIENLSKSGLLHTGTARNSEERDHVLVEKINGIKIAFLAYTYGTNGIPLPEGKDYLVNLIIKDRMLADINKAKSKNVDIIITSLHFGNEYCRSPGKKQKELVGYLVSHGVDIVFGDHPHVLQPMEIIELNGRTGFVIYSLGNFVSDQRKRYRDSGIILNLFLEKNFQSGKTIIKDVNFIPTWVDKSYIGSKLNYRVLPVKEAIKNYETGKDNLLSKNDYFKLKRTLQDVIAHLGEPL